MIAAAEVVAIEYLPTGDAAGADQELASLVVEHHRRDVDDIEVTAEHPVGVRRCVVVHQLQLAVRVHLHRDDRIAQALRRVVKRRVAGADVDAPFGIDRHAAASPYPPPSGADGRAFGGEVISDERVRRAATSLRSRRVDHR